jgi:hypothetical protein
MQALMACLLEPQHELNVACCAQVLRSKSVSYPGCFPACFAGVKQMMVLPAAQQHISCALGCSAAAAAAESTKPRSC